jgi:predicted protein tyrosine phosphatase
MNVIVVSKQVFDDTMHKHGITNDNVHTNKLHFFILIHDSVPRNEQDLPLFDEGPNVKILKFDDVEADQDVPLLGTDEKYKAKAFTKEQAEELIKFIATNKDKETCIVHCSAGYSRSGAVGEFVNDFFGGKWFDFKRKNPHVKPNGTVRSLLKNVWVNKYHDDV